MALKCEDDEALFVRAVLRGETWAERELFERYAPLVHSTLRRCLGQCPDMDDLIQEVFLRVFDRVKTLREFTALRSFVYTITIRVARTDIRRLRLRRRRESKDVDEMTSQEAISADPEAREVLSRVRASLDGMNSKYRIAFVLRHLDGLPVCDVARELEISIATANRWLTRAVKHISKDISDDKRLASLLDRQEESSREGSA